MINETKSNAIAVMEVFEDDVHQGYNLVSVSFNGRVDDDPDAAYYCVSAYVVNADNQTICIFRNAYNCEGRSLKTSDIAKLVKPVIRRQEVPATIRTESSTEALNQAKGALIGALSVDFV